MSSRQLAYFDTLRSLAFGSITSSYVAVGSKFTNSLRILIINNNTDGDLVISTDGSTDQLFLAKGSYNLFDLTTNRVHVEQYWVLPPILNFIPNILAHPLPALCIFPASMEDNERTEMGQNGKI
jgi:hypothetical protein